MKILDAELVRTAARAADVPRDGIPQIALVGRSNVGKSSLINALVRRRLARTSAAPGKTRLINCYRVGWRAGAAGVRRVYLVDLPGYGYARGGAAAAAIFARLTAGYFGGSEAGPAGVLLTIDVRHPDLAADRDAHAWLRARELPVVVVATKIDKLARSARTRAVRALERTLDSPVLPVSAATGEGMDALWTLIGQLSNRRR